MSTAPEPGQGSSRCPQAAAEAGEARFNGWPMGLQQPLQGNVSRNLAAQPPPTFHLSIATPSISCTSDESSSDLDTESTGSFFPERSTTLGSLIGIQSCSHNDQSQQASVPAHAGGMESERRKSTSTGISASLRSRTSCCLMLGCRGSANREALGMSPSLAHLLEEERKSTVPQRQASNTVEEGGGAAEINERGVQGTRGYVGGGATQALAMQQENTLFDEEGILPPQPAGAPLKLILQHTSPSSSYLSADWNVYNNGGQPAHGSNRAGARAGAGPASHHPRFPTFLPYFCGRLGTGLTT